MSLKDDKQQNTQIELDFSSALTGEAREAGREGACWRLPIRASGRNHRRQIAHGLFRASGMVMLKITTHWFVKRVQVRMPGSVLESRGGDRKSTRLNSSHLVISYAVFCLKKKQKL